MSDNEIRPIFRLLTLALSIAAWYAVIIFVHGEVTSFNSAVVPFNWYVFFVTVLATILFFIAAVAFTFTTVFGYMPRMLFRVLTGKTIKN
ncbi:hypothetical protein [Rheinheimera soli]|uniref:Signal transduction histidine kinase n=1 Tax=Rheinheimera soli TaxID=443616 RepID=A0ABU1VYY4_9GAMM|nr:hypothetical protein [Rheinheimera soli]MDR7120926.1 signal transduction histidine kinase [Rheinheimera soli]